jgi:hypothetical protein
MDAQADDNDDRAFDPLDFSDKVDWITGALGIGREEYIKSGKRHLATVTSMSEQLETVLRDMVRQCPQLMLVGGALLNTPAEVPAEEAFMMALAAYGMVTLSRGIMQDNFGPGGNVTN